MIVDASLYFRKLLLGYDAETVNLMRTLSSYCYPSVSDTEWRLVLIKQQECVGKYLLKHDVYKVSRVAILPLSMTAVPDSFDIAVSQTKWLYYCPL